jgi:hypothetical protein
LVAVVVFVILSLVVAAITFGVLHSTAVLKGAAWEITGAFAGFIVTYWMLVKSLKKLEQNVLTAPEIKSIVHLYHLGIKQGLLYLTTRWWISANKNNPEQDMSELAKDIKDTFLSFRQHLCVFDTELGDLVRRLYSAYSEEQLLEDAKKVYALLASRKDFLEYTAELEKLIDARQNAIRVDIDLEMKEM